MRRRLREQRRLRETLLLDLGALVYELHRQGRRAPELLQSKAAELTVVDDEVRELQAALEGLERPAGVEAADAAEAEDERAEDEGAPPDEGEPPPDEGEPPPDEDGEPPPDEEEPPDDESPHGEGPPPDESAPDEREPFEDDTAEFEAQADPDQEPALADHEDSRG
jgi:hypothetical protein